MIEGFELAARGAEEVITREELRELCDRPGKKAYIGFEPSGQVHLGLLICARKISDLTACGFEVTVLLADWHAYINDKFGGDLAKIRACGEYFKDALEALGVPRGGVRYVYASEYIGDAGYWERLLKVSKTLSLSRLKRAMTIMGRKEDELELDSSKLVYPLMQVADIFQLDADLALGGMDQRKAHVLAREASQKLGWKKVVALHTPLLSSLAGGERMDPSEAKMSKSRPDAAMFIHDPPEEIARKLRGAFCPARQTANNPVIDLCRLLIFPDGPLKIERPSKYGGDLVIRTFEELGELYEAEKLHPADLKSGAAAALSDRLAPVREYFEKRPDNWRLVRQFASTR